MAQRARRHHAIGALLFCLPGVFGGHLERVFFVGGQNREAAAFALATEVSQFRAHCGNQVFEIILAAGIFLGRRYHFRRAAHKASP